MKKNTLSMRERADWADKEQVRASKTCYVNFSPDRGMGAVPFSTGPFPTRTHAEGWAMIEMAGQPKNWWSIDSKKFH